jgi:Recombination endonuclease VII
MATKTKWCGRCNQLKPVTDFSKDTARSTGLQHYCKSCNSEYYKKTRRHGSQHRSPADIRARDRHATLRRKYGISVEEYEQILAEQDGVCAICGEDEKDQRWGCLYVDHDHKTGKIRGLLCRDCNLALGLFQDDLALLKRAVRYLRT